VPAGLLPEREDAPQDVSGVGPDRTGRPGDDPSLRVSGPEGGIRTWRNSKILFSRPFHSFSFKCFYFIFSLHSELVRTRSVIY